MNEIPKNVSESVRRRNPALYPISCVEQSPVVECSAGIGALAESKVEEGDSVRFLVVVESFRIRLLDEDNLCEKYHVDCCRYAGLIPDDAPGKAKIEVYQTKVKTKDEEKTVLTITRL